MTNLEPYMTNLEPYMTNLEPYMTNLEPYMTNLGYHLSSSRCLLRMCSSGDTVRLQYRSLARYNPDKRKERSAKAPPPVSAPRQSGTSVSSVTSGASTITPLSASVTPQVKATTD
jgi:hypothetical protein